MEFYDFPWCKHFVHRQHTNRQDFFVKQGVSESDFNDTFSSFSLKRKARWAKKLAQTLKIPAIPGFIVISEENAYWASRNMVESNEEMLELVDFLIKIQEDALKS